MDDGINNSHDPLTVLHGDELVAQPDPAFAARLRARLERALNLPNRTEGVDMSGTDTAIAELAVPTTIVPRSAAVPIQHGDVGYVSVWAPDAERAAAFYGHVLGWTFDPATHQVTNTTQRIGIYSVDSPQGMLCSYAVVDLAAARQAIVAAGGTVGEVLDLDFGALCDATDPAGTSFAVFEPAPGIARPALNGTGPGELSYITYEVPDSNAFRSFYSGLLFWSFEPGRTNDGWQIQHTHPMAGVAGGSTVAVTVPMWTVADIDAAVARVREAGGTVIEEPSTQTYGQSAQCTDDQGTRFYLGQL